MPKWVLVGTNNFYSFFPCQHLIKLVWSKTTTNIIAHNTYYSIKKSKIKTPHSSHLKISNIKRKTDSITITPWKPLFNLRPRKVSPTAGSQTPTLQSQPSIKTTPSSRWTPGCHLLEGSSAFRPTSPSISRSTSPGSARFTPTRSSPTASSCPFSGKRRGTTATACRQTKRRRRWPWGEWGCGARRWGGVGWFRSGCWGSTWGFCWGRFFVVMSGWVWAGDGNYPLRRRPGLASPTPLMIIGADRAIPRAPYMKPCSIVKELKVIINCFLLFS